MLSDWRARSRRTSGEHCRGHRCPPRRSRALAWHQKSRSAVPVSETGVVEQAWPCGPVAAAEGVQTMAPARAGSAQRAVAVAGDGSQSQGHGGAGDSGARGDGARGHGRGEGRGLPGLDVVPSQVDGSEVDRGAAGQHVERVVGRGLAQGAAVTEPDGDRLGCTVPPAGDRGEVDLLAVGEGDGVASIRPYLRWSHRWRSARRHRAGVRCQRAASPRPPRSSTAPWRRAGCRARRRGRRGPWPCPRCRRRARWCRCRGRSRCSSRSGRPGCARRQRPRWSSAAALTATVPLRGEGTSTLIEETVLSTTRLVMATEVAELPERSVATARNE